MTYGSGRLSQHLPANSIKSIGCCRIIWCLNLIIRVGDHTSASSAGAGPMELVSMACPSVVRGRIIIMVFKESCITPTSLVNIRITHDSLQDNS
jgi:hypothetical protein